MFPNGYQYHRITFKLTNNHISHRLEINLQGWWCDDKIAASGLPVVGTPDITGSHCKQWRKQPSVVSKVPAESH